jgi:hypothetical protein
MRRTFEVAAVHDQQPVKTFDADVLTKRSAMAFACGARTGVFTIPMPPLWNTSLKGVGCVNAVSRRECVVIHG